MVKIPDKILPTQEFGEDHPFIAEALRARKPDDVCWCGSGIEYRDCHGLRKQQPRLTLGQMRAEQAAVLWRPRGCMHPRAGSACQGQVIDAHTIQRKGALGRIVDQTKHVLQLKPHAGKGRTPTKMSWRKASTFPGYCSEHDSRVFGELERNPFIGTHEQCVLQTYRNVCHELYKKRASIDVLKYQRTVLDRGLDRHSQIEIQLGIAINLEEQQKAIDELEALRCKFEDVITKSAWEGLESKCYYFTTDSLCMTSAGAISTEYDFDGKHLKNMWDLRVDAEMLSHSVMSTGTGGAIVFAWFREEMSPAAVVASFDRMSDKHKGDVFAQYCFLTCENTYFSEAWWDSLDASQQRQLWTYTRALVYEGGSFIANPKRLLPWRFEPLS